LQGEGRERVNGGTMGQAVEVSCPKCKKIFVVNPHMLGSGMDFHCPFCDLYFAEKDSPKIRK
jgi:uncharacterized Zn-finger protein